MPKGTDEHLTARRRQILDGARRCFAEYGYEKATVRRLEHTIGLSRGAIFHHFRDKDTLFFELAREDAERMADVAAREGLVQVMRDMLAAPDQFDWLATRLEIARKLRNDPEFSRGWSERTKELSAATTERLRKQKQPGRLRDPRRPRSGTQEGRPALRAPPQAVLQALTGSLHPIPKSPALPGFLLPDVGRTTPLPGVVSDTKQHI